MCRNIRTLFNYDPPADAAEIEASALQYVRKVSGYTRPSKANQHAFDAAVADIAQRTAELLDALVTSAPARDREADAEAARERFQARNR